MTCVLLLHGDNTVDGTTTIVDSSDSAHVVASVGAVQTDTAQSKFGGSSILFSSTDYLLLEGSSDFAFGTGDFTIDMWVRLAATGVGYSLYDGRNGSTIIPTIEVTAGNVIKYYTNSADKIVGTTTLSATTWYHVALTRFAGATRLFLNGVQEGTTFVDTNDYVNDIVRPVIGARGTDLTAGRLNGWLDGVRVIKGQAMWTANFTPPTSAYVGDEFQAEEVLMLHFDGPDAATDFRDSSPRAQTLTVNGNAQLDTAQQKFGSASGLFDGTGDFISISSPLLIGGGDFSLEFWLRLNATGLQGRLFSSSLLGLNIESDNKIRFYFGGTVQIASTSALSTGAWYHIALCRSEGMTRLFINGTQEGATAIDATIYNIPDYTIGAASNASESLNGWLDEYRIVSGRADYIANFTPRTASFPALNAHLLLHGDGADASTYVIDDTGRHNVVVNGNAQIDTAQSKFGGSSILFDGTGDYLTLDGHSDFAFGTGDFTIDFWVRLNATGILQILYDGRPGGVNTDQPVIYIASGNTLRFQNNNTPRISGTTTLTTATWYHVAVTRSGTSTKLFLNGVQEGSTYTDSTNYTISSNKPLFGIDAASGSGGEFNGWLDEFRVLKGTAAWTSNFTAPTSPHARKVTSNALLLLHADAPDMGRNITDASDGVHRVYAHFGDAQVDDAQSKFGGSAIKFDGTGDFVGLDGSDDFKFGKGDFTIDCWVRRNVIDATHSIIMFNLSSETHCWLYIDGTTNGLSFWLGGSYYGAGTPTVLAANTWYHIAVTRSGTSVKGFVNGTQEFSGTDSSTDVVISPAAPIIGIRADLSGGALNGWIDELRIVKGTAWWTANFTAPSAPWTGYETLGPPANVLTISNATTLAFAGSAIAAAQFTTTGATTAAFVGAAIGAATFTIAGSTAAAFAASRILSGQFTSTGASALAFSFAVTAAFQFTATGSSTPAFAGTGILSTAFTITPATTPVFAGASTAAGQLTVAGSTTPAFASTTSNIQAGAVTITGSTTAAFAAMALIPAQWTVTASTTIALTGASIAAAQLTVAGSATAAFAATGILSTQWTIAASSSPAFVGASIAAGQLTVAGATTVAFTGTALRSTAFTISNATTAAFVGAANVAAQFTIAGSTTATFAVTALFPAQLTVSLASTVSWKGAGIAAAQFTTTGATALSWIGAALQSGTGALTYVGQSLPVFTGASIAAAQLTVSGSTAAAFIGASIAAAQFTAAGSSTVAFASAKLINGAFTIAGSSTAAFVGSIATVSNLTITGSSSPVFAATGIFSSQWTVSSGATLAFAGTAVRSGAVTVAGSTTAAFTGQLLRAGALTVTGQTVAGFTIRATSAGAFTMAGNSTFAPHATSILGAILMAIGSSNIVFASVAPRQPTITRSRSSQAHPRRTPVTMPKRPPVYG